MSIFFPPDGDPDSDDAEPTAGSEPASSGRRRSRWLVRGLAVVVALVVVTGTAAALYVGSVSRSFTSNLQHGAMLPAESPAAQPGSTAKAKPRPAKANTKAIDYVLLGSDSLDKTDAGAGRSDSLMVLHLAADRRSAYLISFPRDMYVSIPGHGKDKINAAFSFGGAPLAVQTVESLLDTRMDHVALIDFDGFIRLTEQLGGVTVNNPHASKSRGHTFPKGEITVSGDEALEFVRERYALPEGDLDRAERQRLVVQAILKKTLSRDVLADPAQLTGVVSTMAENIVVDDQLTSSQIRRTALSLRMTADDLTLLQAPIAGFATVQGQSIDVVDREGLAELALALRQDTLAAYAKGRPGS